MEENEDKTLKGIMAISGMSGLYKVKATTKNGYIVESLIDGKRMPVTSNQRVSMLDDITVFTQDGDISLRKILQNLKEKEKDGKNFDPKADNEQLKKDFAEIQPDFDKDRVYPSDIKKIFSWYRLLKDDYSFDDPEPEVEEKKAEEKPAEETKENTTEKVKSAKKSTPKKKKADPDGES